MQLGIAVQRWFRYMARWMWLCSGSNIIGFANPTEWNHMQGLESSLLKGPHNMGISLVLQNLLKSRVVFRRTIPMFVSVYIVPQLANSVASGLVPGLGH